MVILRTPDTVASIIAFEATALNHSATPPEKIKYQKLEPKKL